MEYIEYRYTQPSENGVIGLVFEPKETPAQEPEQEKPEPEKGKKTGSK